jgi:hypothetical protein
MMFEENTIPNRPAGDPIHMHKTHSLNRIPELSGTEKG